MFNRDPWNRESRQLLLLLVCSLPWAFAIPGRTFLSDDFTFLEVWARPPWSSTLSWFVTEYTGFYRPLSAVYWKVVDSLAFGEAFGYHLVQHLLHVLNAVLVWRVGRSLYSARPEVGVCAGLIFLYTPGHVFAVLMPAAVPGVLCTTFVLSAVLLDAERKVWLAALCLVLALLTKELAVTLPFLLLIMRAAETQGSWVERSRSALSGAAPYLGVLLAYMALRYLLFGGLTYAPLLHSNTDPFRLLLNAGIYAGTSVAPWGLEDLKPAFRSRPDLALTVVAVGAISLLAFAIRARRNLGRADLIAGTLVLVSIAPVARLFSPWNTYLPAAGGALLVASALGLQPLGRRFGRVALIVWVLSSSVYCIGHAETWRKAGQMVSRLLETVTAERGQIAPGLYIANLPIEVDAAPVFGGKWGLDSALRLMGWQTSVGVATYVHHDTANDDLEYRMVGDELVLSLPSPGSFFRLQIHSVLNRQQRPQPGMSYSQGPWKVSVESIGKQGEVQSVRLSAPEDQRRGLRIWTGSELVSPYSLANR
jgi:hypothetical protein